MLTARKPMTWSQIRLRHLKVKIKSLAEEARIIRSEERKTTDDCCRGSLHLHRVGIVRHEARHSQLAYAYLRRKPYHSLEKNPKELPDRKKLKDLVERFSSSYDRRELPELSDWLTIN